ncbi:TonB-dependent siderophore receptor [Acetobacter suratthaniensis]|uniref:TonB-dependent siderophore receptor n=1 Tax=Acetobacter suratthaniensis TaxID=1502841 RepID=A0ABS3LP47_9PROT|nr:TonB-dependent siderophore receptor [Acetobacter suratthaniensis]MBO1329153.1 TonB-dependent siderophore receptor [Acetobacter suratthaniensis]MCX2567220.1 TonB-dependent siderophore receptor [Acetobacter suratthaniensis]
MVRTGFRALLLASLPGLAAAQTTAAAETHTKTPSISAKTPKKTSAPLVGAAEAITVHTNRNTPHLARKVPLGALGNKSEFETPFSVSSISAARMEAMQANDINDVMRYEPGVQATSNGGSTASGSSVRVRGLNLDWTNGYKIDGMAIPFWYIDLPVANFDTIQVYKGASAFMYGFGSPGGVLDYRLKAPVENRKLTLEAGYRSDAVFRQMLDVGGSLDSAHRIQTRLSFGSEVGDQYNSSFVRNLSMSFTTNVRITDKLHWRFNSFYMNTLQKGMVNTVMTTPGLAVTPISGRAALGAPDSWKTNDLKRFSTGLDWDFARNWTASLTYAYTHLDERFPASQLYFTSSGGDYKSQAYEQLRILTYHQVDFTTQGHFDTGPLHHEIMVGMTWLRQNFDWDANVGAKLPFEYGNIYTDRPSLTSATNFHPRMYRYINYQQLAPFWSDTISWGQWSLMAGARYTAYSEDDFSKTGSTTGSHRNNPVTPVVSLSYRATPWLNAYFSWVQAVQAGGQAPQGTNNYGDVFSPIRSDQYELGVKVQRRTFSGTLALFRMDTGAAYTNAQNYYVQDGVSRYQGIEASASWLVTKDLNLNASLAYLDARYIKAAAGYAGHQLEAVAPFQAAFNADYRIPLVKGLSVNAGFNYVSRSWLDAANTVRMPSYIVGDVGAAYTTHVDAHTLTFRANVENIGNVRYWMSRGSYNIFPGAPRTITLSARLDL